MKVDVSVVVTLYNYAHYIGRCINSFRIQNFANAEMIIVDDGSTDKPFPKVVEAAAGDTRIKYRCLPENNNYSYAKNVGIKMAQGEVIIMLDADDALMPNGITARYNKLMEGYDLVHGPCLVHWDGRPLERDPMWDKWLRTKDPIWIHAQGFAVKRDVHKRVGLYDTRFWAQSDREMLLRIAKCGLSIGEVEEDVALYFRHDEQMHKSKKKQQDRKRLDAMMWKAVDKRSRGNFNGLEILR